MSIRKRYWPEIRLIMWNVVCFWEKLKRKIYAMVVRLKLKVLHWFRTAQVCSNRPQRVLFHPLSISVLVPCVSRVPLSCPTSIEDTLSSSQSHSSMQNQRKCSLLWTLKSNGIPFVSLSVAGPNLFTQHQQSTNNHLSTASCPPGMSTALNQLLYN